MSPSRLLIARIGYTAGFSMHIFLLEYTTRQDYCVCKLIDYDNPNGEYISDLLSINMSYNFEYTSYTYIQLTYVTYKVH